MIEGKLTFWKQTFWTRKKFFSICLFSWLLCSIYTLNPWGWSTFPVWGYVYSILALVITLIYFGEPEVNSG